MLNVCRQVDAVGINVDVHIDWISKILKHIHQVIDCDPKLQNVNKIVNINNKCMKPKLLHNLRYLISQSSAAASRGPGALHHQSRFILAMLPDERSTFILAILIVVECVTF